MIAALVWYAAVLAVVWLGIGLACAHNAKVERLEQLRRRLR